MKRNDEDSAEGSGHPTHTRRAVAPCIKGPKVTA